MCLSTVGKDSTVVRVFMICLIRQARTVYTHSCSKEAQSERNSPTHCEPQRAKFTPYSGTGSRLTPMAYTRKARCAGLELAKCQPFAHDWSNAQNNATTQRPKASGQLNASMQRSMSRFFASVQMMADLSVCVFASTQIGVIDDRG